MSIEIKNFFLQSDLKDQEYMRIHEKYFSEDFIEEYYLIEKINSDGCIYCVILKGMYGLNQAEILAYQQLKQRLMKTDMNLFQTQMDYGVKTQDKHNLIYVSMTLV